MYTIECNINGHSGLQSKRHKHLLTCATNCATAALYGVATFALANDLAVLQNKGTCKGYESPQSVKEPVPAGKLCDLGQQPRAGCDYCDQVYQYQGGPLNTCARDVSPVLPFASDRLRFCVSLTL